MVSFAFVKFLFIHSVLQWDVALRANPINNVVICKTFSMAILEIKLK